MMKNNLRWQMAVDRGGKNAMCDSCQEVPPTDLHHIINKGRTQFNQEARDASECRELMSLLCSDCHIGSNNAHTSDSATELLRYNIGMYGREQVLKKFKSVEDLLNFPMLINFPEEETNGSEETED